MLEVKDLSVEVDRKTILHNVSFEIDHKGKDSWRHSQAGSSSVLIFSSSKLALGKKIE